MRGTILIVDDEIPQLQVLQSFLEEDFDIFQAMNGKEALQILNEDQIDLVITDWKMANMSGIDLIENIKQNNEINDIPVIMVTSKASVADVNLAFQTGVTDYVRKPINKENRMELVARSRSAIELYRAKKELEEEKTRADELLYRVFPTDVAERLKRKGKIPPQFYERVTILFSDFAGFTTVASTMSPRTLINELNTCFSGFDQIVEKYDVERIKTIGDAYMCAGGIPKVNNTNPVDVVLVGLEMQRFMGSRRSQKLLKNEEYWNCRIGINTGTITAGIIGEKRLAYDIWGDAVNIASRMESHGEIGKVNISKNTLDLVQDFFDTDELRFIDVKGKGSMNACFVKGIKRELSIGGEGIEPNEKFKERKKEKFNL